MTPIFRALVLMVSGFMFGYFIMGPLLRPFL